ncbi:MAG: type II secretion system F family protein [Armatimonadota bacterium]
MPTYTYTARDIEGKAISGSLAGANEHLIREQLRRSNLFVTKLDQKGGTADGPAVPSAGFFTQKVKLYEMVVFSRQFSTLIQAGLVLTEALDALADQTRNPTLKNTIMEIKTEVTSGSTLTSAMKKHPKLFSELYLALVEAGETGGMLDQTLETAATALDTEMEIKEKVKSAFVYPIAVLVTAVGVVTFLLAYVVPIFAQVYKQFKSELPGVTKLLVALSAAVTGYWWVAALLAVVATVIYIQAYKTYRGRRVIDCALTRLPLFGHLIEKISLARAAHTLSSLAAAGVPLVPTLSTAGRVSGNSLIVDAMEQVSLHVQQGVSMATAMTETGRFPLLMTRMVAAGEKSGNLSEMLEQVAHFFDREVDYGVKRMMTLIEPIMTVGMGLVVGFILLALYLPVFNLGNVMKN